MAEKFWTIGEAIRRIIACENRFKMCYREDMANILPEYFLELMITSDNQEHLARLVEWHEFFRLGYLAALLRIPAGDINADLVIKSGGKNCRLNQMINTPFEETLEKFREIVREIRFLFDLKTHIDLLGKEKSR